MAEIDDLRDQLARAKRDLELEREESVSKTEARVGALREEHIALSEILESSKSRVAKEEVSKLLTENRRRLLTAEQKILRQMIVDGRTDLDQQQKKIKGLEEANKAHAEQASSIKEGAAAAEDLGQALGQAMKITKGSIVNVNKIAAGLGKAAKAAKGMASGGWKNFGESMLKFAGALGKASFLSYVQIIFDLMQMIVEMSFKIENTTRAMQRNTGMSRKMAEGIAKNIPNVREYTHEFEQLAEAATVLYRTFTDFTFMNEEAYRSMAENATMLNRMGVSYETFGKSAQWATKGMGVAAEDTSEMMRGLTAHAENIGMDIGQLTSAFAESGATLTKFGHSGQKAFKDLALTSKITGIDIQRLLAITEQFDTFEGAAKQAGMLNAALGGNFVNAMDLMMETDPKARFDMIRDSVSSAAGSFDDMGYYQRIYMAKAAGLKDVGELALMMSGRYDLLSDNMGKNASDYETMAQKAHDWQSVQDMLKTELYKMIKPMKEIMPLVQEFIKWLSSPEGKRALEGLFETAKEGIKWLAKPGNLTGVLNTLGGIAANLGKIAIAGAAIWGASALLSVGKWVALMRAGRAATAATTAAQATTAVGKGAKGAKAVKDVVVTGGNAAQRAKQAKDAADAAALARQARLDAAAARALARGRDFTKVIEGGGKAAEVAATKSGRMGTAWKGITTWSRAAVEATKRSIPTMATLGEKSSKILKVVKGWGPAARALGPKIAKVLGPASLLVDAGFAIKGFIDGAGKGLDGWQAPMHEAKTGFDRMSSAMAGMFEGLAKGWEWIGKKIKPDWLSDLLGSDEGYVDISAKEQGTKYSEAAQRSRMRLLQMRQSKARVKGLRAKLNDPEWMKQASDEKKAQARTGIEQGLALQKGLYEGAKKLRPGSLSEFAQDVVDGIAAGEEPLYAAITQPFVRAETLITQIQKNIVSQHEMMAATIAGATAPSLADQILSPSGAPGAATSPGVETKAPVIVQIHLDGALVKEEMIGTIGTAAGFAGITGYATTIG